MLARRQKGREMQVYNTAGGLPWASWHNFRHTTATMADYHMSVHESMALLGHSNARTTAGYTHVSEETMRDRLKVMAASKGVN